MRLMKYYHAKKAADPAWWARQQASMRRVKLAWKYKLTQADIDAKVEEQGGVCGLCALPPTETDKLVIDHDHVTKRFRGMIHRSCNVALGVLGDNATAIQRVLDYLRRD